ncbi:oxysterol-binding protein-related protein 9-like [Dysidea avara]|uniref:oxysterol-binding protein-related protein 9-like n=1 Tax=Dysidea avara TaxID=196820 RepID=UPI0033254166
MATQQSASSSTSQNLEGSLSYWTTVVNKWQNRWYVLKEDGHLYYYASKEKMKRAVHKGRIRLKRAILGPEEPDKISFTIVLEKKTYKFQASNEEEKDKWTKSLREAIQQLARWGDHKNPNLSHTDSLSEEEEYTSEGEDDEGDTLSDIPSGLSEEVVPKATPLTSISSDDTSALSSLGGATCSLQKFSFNDGALNDPDDVELDQEVMDLQTDGDDLQNHRSVILHVLSQLRLGMDLTRVSLPTFILEKRSHLEMYADLFSHPELFLAINDARTPEARMVAAVKFYLTTFHAGRNTDIAKKPYNPVLGEKFQCYIDAPGTSRTRLDQLSESILKSGPLPWAGYQSIQFIAEQVSHHPPISALYAECPAKGMYAFGSIQSKSRFLGLSVGIQNIGQIRIVLMGHNEEYIATLPSAYGRSILTVPWVELGGKCVIDCPQTGYTAHIEFHCKPRYGGKRHRVTTDIRRVKEKKPVLRIEGDWNGVLYTKNPDKTQELFADTSQLQLTKKKLKKLDVQESNESRRVWCNVTKELKASNERGASDAKHAVEERQRAIAKDRKEKGEEWLSQIFHLEGDQWIYNRPLNKRVAEIKDGQ